MGIEISTIKMGYEFYPKKKKKKFVWIMFFHGNVFRFHGWILKLKCPWVVIEVDEDENLCLGLLCKKKKNSNKYNEGR